jgi:hypothetical protein
MVFLIARVRWCSRSQTYQFHIVMRHVEHRYPVYYQFSMKSARLRERAAITRLVRAEQRVDVALVERADLRPPPEPSAASGLQQGAPFIGRVCPGQLYDCAKRH